ncbi:MAG TPA: Smr/MutS family protein [Pyrinomonadaceae bacterium]|nr:Smr/MutS family protein [Pyrinomonadaceae bacterium]
MPLLDWLKTLSAARRRTKHGGETYDVAGDAARDADDAQDDTDEDEYDPENPFPEPVTLEITDVFDLHAIAPRDVERAVRAYLQEARRARFPSVRIIHGKGRGVQRKLVHKILAETADIRDWTDAPPQSGGWGATVAHFTLAEEENDPSGASDA